MGNYKFFAQLFCGQEKSLLCINYRLVRARERASINSFVASKKIPRRARSQRQIEIPVAVVGGKIHEFSLSRALPLSLSRMRYEIISRLDQ